MVDKGFLNNFIFFFIFTLLSTLILFFIYSFSELVSEGFTGYLYVSPRTGVLWFLYVYFMCNTSGFHLFDRYGSQPILSYTSLSLVV